MNKDNLIEFIPKDKYSTDPDRYKKFLHRYDIDTTELSAQGVNWNALSGSPIIKESQLIPYKSLIRKIFDWFIVKGI